MPEPSVTTPPGTELQGIFQVKVNRRWQFSWPKRWSLAKRTGFLDHWMHLGFLPPEAGRLRVYTAIGRAQTLEVLGGLDKVDRLPFRHLHDMLLQDCGVEQNARGQLLIPKYLRHWITLTPPYEALLVGMGAYAEFWPGTLFAETLDAQIDQALMQQLAGHVPLRLH